MSSPQFHRHFLTRLPLPIAQLYSRAYNAKDARGRHDNAFYLFEALIKLAGAPLVACYLNEVEQGTPRLPALDRLLAQLALPSLGQWVAILRELSRHFGARPDAVSHPLGHMWTQLTAPRRESPALVALYRQIKNGPDEQPGGDQSCTILELIDKLVTYRNGVFGHGAARFDSFYDEQMGPLLFPAINDLLAEGVLDLLGPVGSRLVYVTELRTVDVGRVQVGLRELVGLEGERMSPLELEPAQSAVLLPNRVAILWPGRPAPLRLDPLLQYRESDLAEEVLFLNRDRNGRQIEYLSYTTGRTERDKSMLPAMTALLSRVTNRTVTEADLERLTQQSIAETSSVEQLFDSPHVARQVGDYELLAEIGRGGMGVVYLARQLSLGRLVALKMLPADLAGDEVALARFRREVRHLARCEHPNIIKVLSSGTFPDGQTYYTMEYVPGSDLEMVWRELAGPNRQGSASTLGNSTWAAAVLSASHKRRDKAESSRGRAKTARDPNSASEGIKCVETSQVVGSKPANSAPMSSLPPLPDLVIADDDPGGYVRYVVTLIRDAALALQAVHDQGIVHRDVKPANLMLTHDCSRLVLMDFGLAKGESLAMSASRSAGFLGTLRYAAPEQLAAATLKVGPTADVRGLGATLWELLTRERLFGDAEDEAQLAHCVHEQDVPRLRAIDHHFDRDLEAIVARATERRIADRIASAGHLADYLQLFLDGKPLPIRPPTTVELFFRWTRAHRALVSSVMAAAVVICSAIAISFIKISGASELANEQRELAQKESAEKGRALVFAEKQTSAAKQALAQKSLAFDELQTMLAASYFQQGLNECAAGRMSNGLRELRRAHALALSTDRLKLGYRHVLFDRLLRSGQTLGLPMRHGHDIEDVVFSPDGSRVVTASSNVARLWDSRTGAMLGEPMFNITNVSSMKFSPDGSRILAGCGNNMVQTWDARTAKSLGAAVGAPLQIFGTVVPVKFSSDGSRFVARSGSQSARLWDVQTGAPLGEPLNHGDDLEGTLFAPDGACVATIGGETARLWDARTGVPLGPPMPNNRQLQFCPDGSRIVTTEGEIAQLWDARTCARLGEPMRHEYYVNEVDFSADGSRVVTASNDSAHLWDAWTGAPMGNPMRHNGGVWHLAISPDGSRILTGGTDKVAKLWDAHTTAPLGEPMRHEDIVHAVTFSPDGSRIATGSLDTIARLWDGWTAAPLAEPLFNEGRRLDSWGKLRLKFSPDGSRMATSSGNTAWLWDVRSGAPLSEPMRHKEGMAELSFTDAGWLLVVDERRQPKAGVGTVMFSPDGSRILTGSDDGTARQWDAQTGAPLNESMDHASWVEVVRFSPDGTQIVTGSMDKTARLWDARTGVPLGLPMQHEGWVLSLAFSPDGSRVVTGCGTTHESSGVAQIWDARTGLPVGAPMIHKRAVRSVAFSPDGLRIMTGSNDFSARLWNAQTGVALSKPLEHEMYVRTVAFSPDGSRAVTASEDNTARLWDTASSAAIGLPMRHEEEVFMATFSPDGSCIATASKDNTARLWNASTGAPLGMPMRHESAVICVVFSPDGSRVATGSKDDTARLWDCLTGAPLGVSMRHKEWVRAIAFSPDGSRIVTGSYDDVAQQWRLPKEPELSAKDFELWAEIITGEKVEMRASVTADINRTLTSAPTFRALAFRELLQRYEAVADSTVYKKWVSDTLSQRFNDWHNHEAARAEQRTDWFAATFHLRHLLKKHSTDTVIDGRLKRAEAQLLKISASK